MFANAFVDQRMMAWLLEQPDEWSFEVWGDWAHCTSPKLDAVSIPALIASLEGLCGHIPRVARTLRPAVGRDPS